jgi:predicted enzyme related to lactoylglutathione lyase
MTTFSGYSAGSPCWYELATTDQEAAKRFYAELFGWVPKDVPIPEGGNYSIFQLGDRDVGAAYTMMPDQQAAGMPSYWAVYFAVASADDMAARAVALGGKQMAAPMDVMDVGRMAVIADPEGAVFCLWQPKSHAGAGAVHENNAVGWVELATRDSRKAAHYYAHLFGWKVREQPHPVAGHYQMFSVDSYDWGGMLPMNADWGQTPAHWHLYFRVADCDAAAEKLKALGGKVMAGPFDGAGVGRIAVVTDPQGATFYLITFRAP